MFIRLPVAERRCQVATLDKIFFTSDTHFGHSNIIKYCKRPYSNAVAMDEALVENWNKVVPGDGLVYHLGDVAFLKPAHVASLLYRLNGTIVLIRGNHDSNQMLKVCAGRFEAVVDYVDTTFDKSHVTMMHFPLGSWHGQGRGSWNLHGHSHGSYQSKGKQQDVGVDALGYTPISFYELRALMDKKDVRTSDYHKLSANGGTSVVLDEAEPEGIPV